MFRLISIQQTEDNLEIDPSKRPVRCTILADNTTDPLPEDGTGVENMHDGQKFMPGSVAITQKAEIAIVGNSGEWGEWV